MTESDEERALGGVHGKMLKVCNFVSNHEEAWVFYGHVTEEMAPGYSKIIRRPMCLKAIEDKIKAGFQKMVRGGRLRVVQTQAIFEFNVGKRRSRHRTTLKT